MVIAIALAVMGGAMRDDGRYDQLPVAHELLVEYIDRQFPNDVLFDKRIVLTKRLAREKSEREIERLRRELATLDRAIDRDAGFILFGELRRSGDVCNRLDNGGRTTVFGTDFCDSGSQTSGVSRTGTVKG